MIKNKLYIITKVKKVITFYSYNFIFPQILFFIIKFAFLN
ncbi:hypothetical protein HMPREF1982_03301 [Clostridiales bacterium oral taxon 876 str. F0540]|nr:hypothetical protein HMPREF1982_03301 [Clostridiales bacterium oral taxon 876 str. F0540]